MQEVTTIGPNMMKNQQRPQKFGKNQTAQKKLNCSLMD